MTISGATDQPGRTLVVLGATGATGRLLVSQALDQGHQVVALARRPDAVAVQHPRLHVHGFDVLSRNGDLAPFLAGADAVLSALGSRERRPTTVYSRGVELLAQAMAQQGVRRLVCISSDGIDVPAGMPWAQRLVMAQVIQRLYRHQYDDMRRMEEVLAHSTLAWTVIRAPMLTNGPPLGHTRVSLAAPILDGGSLRRADLAQFMIDAVTMPETIGRLAHLASPRKDSR